MYHTTAKHAQHPSMQKQLLPHVPHLRIHKQVVLEASIRSRFVLQSTTSKPEEDPLWVKREKQRELEAKQGSKGVPWPLYLVASVLVAIAAVSRRRHPSSYPAPLATPLDHTTSHEHHQQWCPGGHMLQAAAAALPGECLAAAHLPPSSDSQRVPGCCSDGSDESSSNSSSLHLCSPPPPHHKRNPAAHYAPAG